MWKQPVGIGYASFVAANGRAFTIEQRGKQEVVAAYEVLTGRELWTHTWNRSFGGNQGGPRATPTWYDGVVYALGATGELRALADADGRQIWRTDILEDAGAGNLDFGMAASPLVVDDTVVVLPGGGNGKSVAAYDRRTGKLAWSALDDPVSYSSPMLATIEGVRQILVLTASRVVGLTPDRGGLLWEFPWPYEQNPPQPMILGDRVFISTSSGGGAVMLQLTREGDRFAARELWRTNRMKNNFSSSVHHDGFIYGLDEFILACIDASTGELKWKGGRYGYGQVMLASGHLIVTTEQGEIALVRAASESHQEVVRFAAIEGQTYNHPAIADGILLIRNGKEMAAFDLRSK
jgi:outer membrane protein assembly factor BamB